MTISSKEEKAEYIKFLKETMKRLESDDVKILNVQKEFHAREISDSELSFVRRELSGVVQLTVTWIENLP